MRETVSILTVALLGSLLCSGALAAGPKKISKCKTITESGSYIVSKNLEATAKTDGHCIVIDADFVTLDLSGYTLGGNGTGIGVWDNDATHQGIVVRNGMITGFDYGIELSDVTNCTVERVTAIDNGARAIEVGDRSIVTGNIVAEANYGIRTGEGYTVNGNTALDTENYAISVGVRSNVLGNSASANFGGGVHLDAPAT